MKSSTGRVVEELLKNLEQLDSANEYKVLVLESEKNYYKPSKPNFEVLVADFLHYTFAEQLGLNTFLRKLKPDLVFFYMPQQPLLYTGATVTFVHDLNLLRVKENDMGKAELAVKKLIFGMLLWIVSKRSNQLIVPTQFTKDDLERFARIPAEKITVSSEGMIDIGPLEPMPEYGKKPFIIYLGRAEPYKNNRRLIQAHQSLLAKNPELSLVIAGPVDDLRKADIAWVKQNGYKRVLFVDWPSDEQAAWLYKNAEAFVQPSLMEGFGLPVLEAMQQGTPVASTNATCSPEVYGDAANYFDPLDTKDMTRAIDEILTDKDLRANLIKKGYKQVKKYSWRDMSVRILDVFKQVLKQS
jgi:glycosyltransferase involved in cell wall biosynthesis